MEIWMVSLPYMHGGNFPSSALCIVAASFCFLFPSDDQRLWNVQRIFQIPLGMAFHPHEPPHVPLISYMF
jgi:hypothetical protein